MLIYLPESRTSIMASFSGALVERRAAKVSRLIRGSVAMVRDDIVGEAAKVNSKTSPIIYASLFESEILG